MLRPFDVDYPGGFGKPGEPRATAIIARLLGMDASMVARGLRMLAEMFENRHRESRKVLLRRFAELAQFVPPNAAIDDDRKLLIGAFFSEEYSFEAAALFNPSIVVHPDQAGLAPGAIRFVMSLRGIGEGHISSVTFRTGIWATDGGVVIDPPSVYAVSPMIETLAGDHDAASLYVQFEDAEDISEAVLFPMAPSQKQGIEDLRLVTFSEDDGSTSFLGTFTAFSGSEVRQEILKTNDFKHFSMRPLTGKMAVNKGMALFPRRIDGRYVMLGRQDNENIWLMHSDDLFQWMKPPGWSPRCIHGNSFRWAIAAPRMRSTRVGW